MTSRQKALRIAAAASDGKADELVILDLRKSSSSFDYFILCSATSTRRAQAIADGIEEALRSSGARLWHTEGYAEGGWVLLDYGSVVAHIFDAEARTFYQLERLWYDAPRIGLSSLPAPENFPRGRCQVFRPGTAKSPGTARPKATATPKGV